MIGPEQTGKKKSPEGFDLKIENTIMLTIITKSKNWFRNEGLQMSISSANFQ